MFGLLFTVSVWTIIMVVQPYSRYFGLAWMAIGLAIYILFRRRKGYSLGRHIHPHPRATITQLGPEDRS